MPPDSAVLMPGLDPEPVALRRPRGASPFVLVCDHASARLPARLARLGLADEALASHVAWDIGAAAVARGLSRLLDAVLIEQRYSRLAVDCNRPPGSADSILSLSEHTRIPGNEGVSAAQAVGREKAIFWPYHACIAQELDRRAVRGQRSILLALHSFTPVYKGLARPWHLGLLYHRDPRLGRILLGLMHEAGGDWVVGDNEPYSVDDETDYTLPVHGERRGIPHLGLEIRQDLITDVRGQVACARRLAPLLNEAARRVQAVAPPPCFARSAVADDRKC